MNCFIKTIHMSAKRAEVLPMVALFVMMVLAALNCIIRRLGYPISATVDYIGFLFILVVAPALAHCEVQGAHISLNMFTDKMLPKVQNIVQIIVSVLCFAFCALSTWALFVRALRTMSTGLTGMSTPIPVWPFIFIECLSLLLLALVYLASVFISIRRLKGATTE
jgi:TRAP-type C4-dicarboxylate transport system permease small subunit